jgi:hypothetical protein
MSPPGDPRKDCKLTVEDHSASCPDPCPIETDVTLSCGSPTEPDIGLLGFRVGAADDSTLLATTGRTQAWVAEVRRDSFEPRSLPVEWALGRLELLLSPSGALYVASLLRAGVHFATVRGAEVESELVVAWDEPARETADFAVDSDGIAHLWMSRGWNGGTADGFLHATRGTSAGWELETLDEPDGARFALATDGAPVSYSVPTDGTIRTVHAGRTIDFSGGSIAYVPVRNQPGDAGPPYAVIAQGDGDLRAVWPDGAGSVVDVLPETPVLAWSCGVQQTSDFPCPSASCHDSSEGVIAGVFAADRAPDGAVWIAYVYRRLDLDVTYVSVTFPETSPPGRWCNASITRNETTDELHLVRVPRGEMATTELVLPIRGYGQHGASTIELDVRGAAVAIGMPTASGIRVLRVNP